MLGLHCLTMKKACEQSRGGGRGGYQAVCPLTWFLTITSMFHSSRNHGKFVFYMFWSKSLAAKSGKECLWAGMVPR